MVSSDFRLHYGRRIVSCAISRYDPDVGTHYFWNLWIWIYVMQRKFLDFPRRCRAEKFYGIRIGVSLQWALDWAVPVFQALSGKTVKSLSESMGYTTAYDYLIRRIWINCNCGSPDRVVCHGTLLG